MSVLFCQKETRFLQLSKLSQNLTRKQTPKAPKPWKPRNLRNPGKARTPNVTSSFVSLLHLFFHYSKVLRWINLSFCRYWLNLSELNFSSYDCRSQFHLTAWDRRCIPLHLRTSRLNNWRTSCQNLMKIEMGSLMIVLTLIPKSQKIITIEWRSAPDTFSPIWQRAASFNTWELQFLFWARPFEAPDCRLKTRIQEHFRFRSTRCCLLVYAIRNWSVKFDCANDDSALEAPRFRDSILKNYCWKFNF